MPPQTISLDTDYNARLRKICLALDEKYLANKQPTDMFSDRRTLAGGGSHFMKYNPSGSTAPWIQPQMLAQMEEIPMSGGGKHHRNSVGNTMKDIGHFLSPAGKTLKKSAKHVATDVALDALMGMGLSGGKRKKSDVGKFLKKVGQSVKPLAPIAKKVKKIALPIAEQAASQAITEALMSGAGRPRRIGLPKPRVAVASIGGKRPASAWIEHVKAHAAKHGVSYKQAMTDAKHTYRK